MTWEKPEARWLRPDEAAARIGLAARTLRRWRKQGKGPPWTRLGCKAVGYDRALLEAWIEDMTDKADYADAAGAARGPKEAGP